ncbi:hypothetical protein JXA32_15300 [Candidatus Sumerlaeota bacterium]|nr:hypothetical protein [Candidatus Sumerlaeota bacterium]
MSDGEAGEERIVTSPGLGLVNADSHYGFFDGFSKLWLSLLMTAGRLELFSIIVLFAPSFWRTR